MEHEAAHDLYQTLKSYDAGAKAKQGLGFGNEAEERADRVAELRRRDAAAAQSSAGAGASAGRSEHHIRETERRDAGAAGRHSYSDRHRGSRASLERHRRTRASPEPRRSSRQSPEQRRGDDPRQADRWLMDDERQADDRHAVGRSSRRSPAGERDAGKPPARDGSSRANGRDRDGSRRQFDARQTENRDRRRPDSSRDRGSDGGRGSDRDRGSDRGSYRGAETRRADRHTSTGRQSPPRHSRRSRTRSRSPIRRRHECNGKAEPAARDDGSRYAERDRHSSCSRQQEPSNGRQPSARPPPPQKPAEPDWHKVIDGYDQMTQAMRLRARMRYQLRQATTKASDDGQQWTSFKFDDDQPLDGDDAATELDAKELPDGAARVDVSHEASQIAHAAIFGSPPNQAGSGSEDDEDLPQVVELPGDTTGADDALPTVVEEAAGPSQPKLSWREKAAQLKAQRGAQDGIVVEQR